MTHPIAPYMPAVFIPVRDLKTATEWYASLLDRQLVPQSDQDSHGIYIFDFAGSQLILEGNSWGSPPAIMFDAVDAEAAHAFCETYPHETITDVFSDEYLSVFNLNSLMICKAKRDLDLPGANKGPVLFNRVGRVFIHADELAETVRWYEGFLARKAEPDSRYGGLPVIRMDRGPHLLIDDNRLSRSPRVFYEGPQLDRRVNPIVSLETPDLATALEHVRAKGAVSEEGVETRLGVRFFRFRDPDGNELMVCEEADRGER